MKILFTRTSLTGFLVLVALAAAYTARAEEGPLHLYSVTPCRLVDTRDTGGATGGPALGHLAARSFPVYGALARNCGIPPTARAAVLNVVAVLPTSGGYLAVYPYGDPIPPTSTMNFANGEIALANGAIIPLPPDPTHQLTLQVTAIAGLAGASHEVNLILDITGYFE